MYLYAVGAAGYGAASDSLLSSSGSNTHLDGSGNYYVSTDSSGNFDITSDYNCPSSTSQLYLYSIEGNPGSGPNSASGLLAGLGSCGDLKGSTYIVINEVSTVATAYALAGFAVDATHFSSSGSALALTDVANAFASITNLETPSTGLALTSTPANNGTVPQSEINTLANILAACINSTGPGSSACATLFSNARNGATTPGDTATAALNIAHNPGVNVANLFALQTATSPFQPMLSAAPNDWTISLLFTGGGMTQPGQLAIDAAGNVWIGNVTTLSEFSPLGAPLSGSSGIAGSVNSPSGLAVDTSGNVWVADFGTSNVSEFNSGRSEVSGSPFSGGGLNGSYGIAFDKSGNAWVGNYNSNTVSEFTSGGSPITGSAGYTFTGLTQPDSLAVDISNNVWVNGYGGGVLAEFNSSGTALAGSSAYSGSFAGLLDGYTVAVDAAGNLWVPNYDYGTVLEFEPGTGYLSPSGGYFGGGLYDPLELAIDGAGNVWVANFDNILNNTSSPGSISEFSPSGVAITGNDGYISNFTNQTNGIAVDGSGNLWVPSVANNGLVEFVGAAAPIVTPTVANLLAPYGSQAVNKP